MSSVGTHEEHAQMLLFDTNLGIARNQLELEELLKQYRHPEFDPLYVCLATRADREKERQWIEGMWVQYQQFADRNFVSEFKVHFSQRAWELYLGVTLDKRWCLHPERKSKQRSAGPDFKTIHHTSKGAQTIWIEAIVVTKGTTLDRVPKMMFEEVGDLPEDKMLFRLTNGLAEKHKKYQEYSKIKVIRAEDPYVIAINRSELEYLDPQVPLILKCLFQLEYQVLFTEPKRSYLEDMGSYWSTRGRITKENGSAISMSFFDDPKYSGISAIIYAKDDIINSPRLSKEMGDNFTIVLNPHAKNPLPEELLTFGNIWQKEGQQIVLTNMIKHA